MTKERQAEIIRDTLKIYLLPDCLKPQYDGMMLLEIATKCLDAIEFNQTDYYNKARLEDAMVDELKYQQDK